MLSLVHSSENVSADLAKDMWGRTPPCLCSPSPIKSDLRVRIKYARVPSAGSTWSVRMMTLKFLDRSQCSDPVSGNAVKIAGRGCFFLSERHFCCVTVSSLLMDAGCSSFKRKEACSETKLIGSRVFFGRGQRGPSGDQVTAMWRWGLHSLWLNITTAERAADGPVRLQRRVRRQ